MLKHIEVDGVRVNARDLIARGRATSWPDIFSTDVNGNSIRWQYANGEGPCPRDRADRVLLPFSHGRLAKGTQLAISP